MAKLALRIVLCDIFNIECPVITAGMEPFLVAGKPGAPIELVVPAASYLTETKARGNLVF